MPDYSFISTPPQNSGLKPISEMLDLAQRSQALQQGQQTIQRGDVALQKERALLQPGIEQGKAESESAVTGAARKKFEFQREQASTAYNEAAALFADPVMKTGDTEGQIRAIVNARKRMVDKGVPEPHAEALASELIAKTRTPGAVHQELQNIVRANAGPQHQANVIDTPLAPVSTGNAIQYQQLQPNAQGGLQPGAQTPTTLGPGGVESIEQDAAGNKHVVSRSPQGSILSTRPMPNSASPGGRGFTTYAPGQKEEIEASRGEVNTIRQNADQAPTMRNINREILKLSEDTKTGPGSERWQTAIGAAVAPFGGNASSYQELGKYLEKNAIQNMQTMGGPPSDARLTAAAAANGSTSFNKEALQAVTKFNDATASALIKYREGLDKAIGLENANYAAVPAFKAAWAKALDVDVFRYMNAVESGDKAEINKILGKTKDGKPTAASIAKAKTLAEKSRELNRLANGGQ